MVVQDNGQDGPFKESKMPSFVERGFSMVKCFADEWDIRPYARRWGGLEVEHFVHALKEGQGEDRLIAICALGSTGEFWVGEVLRPYLESEDPKARWASALMLGERKDEQALSILKTMLLEFLPSPPLPSAQQEQTDPLYDFWRPDVAHVLGNWRRPELIPLFGQAIVLLWDISLKVVHSDKAYWFNCQDELAYALGRLGAFTLLANLELPPSGLRLAMVQMAAGYLDARSCFPYLYATSLLRLHMQNPTLTEEVMSVLEHHLSLPRQDPLRFLAELSRANTERNQLNV